MISLAQARSEVFSAVGRLDPRALPLSEALGLVTSADLVAEERVPPFANSAMDGYAVQAGDTEGASEALPIRLAVVGELPAGRAPTTTVAGGQAIRIMTGAPVPEGADAIVMVEHTVCDGDSVLVKKAAKVGDHVRPAGGDIEEGTLLFPAGTVLSAAHLGVAASLGYARLPVRPRARVGVLSTGDEVVAPGEPLTPGKIRDSNRPMLLALLRESGCEPIDLGIAPDDESAITSAIERGLQSCDALVTTGGVSVGDYDYVKIVLDRLGEMSWWQVAIKPAKPLAFGLVQGKPVFGLPGNPVSSHVSFELFARPALLQMMGHTQCARPIVLALAEQPMQRQVDGKVHFDRVRLRYRAGGYSVARSGEQGSNVLSAMAAANGLAILPDGAGIDAGQEVAVMMLDSPPSAIGVLPAQVADLFTPPSHPGAIPVSVAPVRSL